MLLFQYLGVLYAWGVIQAELSRVGLANSLQLSLIGATAAFCLAFGCLPVNKLFFNHKRLVRLGLTHTGRLDPEKSRPQMDSSVWNNWVRPLSDTFRFQPPKSRRSDFPAWLCVRRIRITRLPCEFPSEANKR